MRGDDLVEGRHNLDGSLCECVEKSKSATSRSVGTPHTIDALNGSKTVCYTRDVDLGVEYQGACTSDNPCEGRCARFYTMECLDNGHMWHGERCDSCDNSGCDPYDITVAMGGFPRCNPATGSWGWDNDLDGTIDECEGAWTCGYHETCQGELTDGGCELSGDITSSLSGTTNHGNAGWCYSDLDQDMGCAASPVDCWNICIDEFGDALVAIDWWRATAGASARTIASACQTQVGTATSSRATRPSPRCRTRARMTTTTTI